MSSSPDALLQTRPRRNRRHPSDPLNAPSSNSQAPQPQLQVDKPDARPNAESIEPILGRFVDPHLESSYRAAICTKRSSVTFLGVLVLVQLLIFVNQLWSSTVIPNSRVAFLIIIFWSLLVGIVTLLHHWRCVMGKRDNDSRHEASPTATNSGSTSSTSASSSTKSELKPVSDSLARESEMWTILILVLGVADCVVEALQTHACANPTSMSYYSYHVSCGAPGTVFVRTGLGTTMTLVVVNVRGFIGVVHIATVCTLLVVCVLSFGGMKIDVACLELAKLLCVALLIALAVIMQDRGRRQQFLILRRLVEQEAEADAKKHQLYSTLSALVPRDTIEKVLRKETSLDSNSRCCVGVFQIYDYARWSTTQRPRVCVEVVDTLFCAVDRVLANQFPSLSKMLTTGDIFIYSLGLRKSTTREKSSSNSSDIPASRKDGAQHNVQRTKEPITDTTPMVKASTNLVELSKGLPSALGLQVTVGLATGPCVAAMFGNTSLRYNLLGPALDIALALSRASLPMCTSVCPVTKELLRDSTGLRKVDGSRELEVHCNIDSPATRDDGREDDTTEETSIGPEQSPEDQKQLMTKEDKANSPVAGDSSFVIDDVGIDNAIAGSFSGILRLDNGQGGSSSPSNSQPVQVHGDYTSTPQGRPEIDPADAEIQIEQRMFLEEWFHLRTVAAKKSNSPHQPSTLTAHELEEELAACREGLAPRYPGHFLVQDFLCPQVEEKFKQYAVQNSSDGVFADFGFSAFNVITLLWTYTHRGWGLRLIGTWQGVVLGCLACLVFLVRTLHWLWMKHKPNHWISTKIHTAAIVVPTFVLQLCFYTWWEYVANPSYVARGNTAPILVLFLGLVFGAADVTIRWKALTVLLMIIPWAVPNFLAHAFLFAAATHMVVLFILALGGIVMSSIEAERRRSFKNSMLAPKLAAIALAHSEDHRELLQMVIPTFVVDDALAKLQSPRRGSIVKDVPDAALLCCRLDNHNGNGNGNRGGGGGGVTDALRLYTLVEEALEGQDIVVIVSIVGNQITLGGPMVQTAVETRALQSSHVEMAGRHGPRSHRDHQRGIEGFKAGLTLLRTLKHLKRELKSSLTAILALGDGFASVIGGQHPSFDVTGSVKCRALTLLQEAPQGYCGVTGKFVKHLEVFINDPLGKQSAGDAGEEPPQELLSSSLGEAIKWRVRGLGLVSLLPVLEMTKK